MIVGFSGKKVGGTFNTSVFVLKELKIIIKKGSIVKINPAESTR